jgi:hypothetical protein
LTTPAQATHDAFDILTLVVAIAGFALATASLVWQGATFALSGSRVKVTMLAGGLGPGGAVVYPASQGRRELPAGYNERVLAINARNVGRLDVSVNRVGAVFDNKIEFLHPNYPANKALPHRLQHGSDETWYLPWATLVDVAHAAGTPLGVRLYVELGTGKRVVSREHVEVPMA